MRRFVPLFLVCALSSLYVSFVHAQTAVEFDPSMLMALPNQPVIDIRRFNQSGAISAGNYRLDIFVNGKWRGLGDVVYVDEPSDLASNAKLCLSDELIKKLDVKPATRQLLSKQANGCYELSALKDAHATLDVSSMRLDFDIPQIHLIDRPDDDTDQAVWDRGVNSVFLGYQFNHYRTDSEHTNNTRTNDENYLGVNTGVNLNRWHFRHQGWAKQTDDKSTHYQALNTYVSTSMPSIQSELTLGDFYTDGTLIEGNAMRGVRFATDNRMLPASLQGYAPTIHGVAHSNAKVSIFQNDQEIYSTTVPAGAFELTNVRDVGSGGDLTVVITEADGRQTRQTVPYSSAIRLLRPNRHHYGYATGRVRHHNTHLYDDVVMQGTWQRGLTNQWTLNTGFLYTDHYRLALLGSALGTKVGAFSVNATHVQYTPYQQNRQHGHELRLQYHRLFPKTNTNIHANVRYFDRYQSLSDILESHHHHRDNLTTHPKYQYQLSVSQPLGKRLGSLYGFFGRTTQDDNHSYNQWRLGYSHHIGRLSYSISAQNTQSTHDGTWDKQYLLSLSLPLGERYKHHVNSFSTHAQGQTHHQVGLAGTFENIPHLQYGLNVGHGDDNRTSWSANASYQLPFAKLSGSYGQHEHTRQYGFGVSGAMVLHQGGLTHTSELGDTFAIVHLPHGKGASLNSVDNIRFDKKGYAILPHLSPYRTNTLSIDPEGLPYEVQLGESSGAVVPFANASVLMKFDSTVGRMVLFHVKLADGSYPRMGANVHDAGEQVVSFVAQDGRVFLQNAQEIGTLYIQWGESEKERCQFNYRLSTPTPNTPITHVHAVCHPTKSQSNQDK